MCLKKSCKNSDTGLAGVWRSCSVSHGFAVGCQASRCCVLLLFLGCVPFGLFALDGFNCIDDATSNDHGAAYEADNRVDEEVDDTAGVTLQAQEVCAMSGMAVSGIGPVNGEARGAAIEGHVCSFAVSIY